MKTFLIALTLLTTSAFANEIGEVQGQKFVLFSVKTAQAVEKALTNSALSKDQKMTLIQKELVKEKTYCAEAGKILGGQMRDPKQIQKRCQSLLSGGGFAQDLVSNDLEASELGDFLQTLSQYFTILLSF